MPHINGRRRPWLVRLVAAVVLAIPLSSAPAANAVVPATYAIDQAGAHDRSSSATSLPATFAAPITSGDLLIAVYGGRGALTTVIDSQGQTWTKRVSAPTNGSGALEVWTSPVTVPGTKPTVTAV